MGRHSVEFSDKLIDDIAFALDCDMVCCMNPDTYEVEDVPHDVLSGMYQDDLWQEALNRVDRWGAYITIDRPGLPETVKIMQAFVDDYVPVGNLRTQLSDILRLRRPYKHFHDIVENSNYRDEWATYNRRQMMQHVKRKLRTDLTKKSSLPSTALF